ncbi:hypothetical protein GZ77_02960 [Endozoicomonas montiporae]|uniref:Uncharacterized protein n=2 Tax=Endozoicomonas montiporae TaxID=1027273 RepID=A0A081NAW4_9GAMM|nr:DUF6586 family protein [Endozoicomonas montiporae]AMO56717.1 hypothetical protein EZMO1_2654 [Endozoicomonas montiporae CL-33]KEQ15587.1 hypothetical protein GZ77_02960 [Endozoicomonas montiporae]
MQNNWTTNTNKRLHFARLQLDAWKLAERQEALAFREGFILQLQLAWRSLLAEILEPYRISCESAPTFAEAMSLVRQKEQIPSEFAQLEAMLESGWLSQIDFLWQSLFVSFQPESPRQSNDLIQLVSHDSVSDIADLTVESATDYLKRFKELVGHFRNFNLEW